MNPSQFKSSWRSGTATVTVAYQGTKHTPTSPACHGRPPRRGGRDRLHAAPRVVMEDRDAEPRRRRAPPLRSLPLRLLRLRRCPEPPELHQHCTPLPSPLSDSCVLSSDDGLSLARAAGQRPGHRLAGDPVHLLHALLRGRVARGHPAGQRACTRPRHQRLPALHPRQPRPGMVRVSWLLIGIRLSKRAGKHG
jgi:hypothetical protein